MFNFLKNRGQKFSELHLAVCLVDGQQTILFVQNTTAPIIIQGQAFPTDLIFQPHAKGNRTLLGVDFLRTSEVTLYMSNNCWYFGDKRNCRIPFSKAIPQPVNCNPVEVNISSCLIRAIITNEVLVLNNLTEEIETNNLCVCMKKKIRPLMQEKRRNYPT
ncbi:retrovirus-related Pol polyprotein from transposon 412 [Nephila pilipes]|uniref:Retrovirus-related Pol polyprotein from transposon 412 n=1 Tax=Nephila pilipes TaxID=299642 RepID=A0A8X6NRW3_NEPPI|nr:retrovirus-related Pol polyprotein from transposon 412 [Nephila pilipes]